MSEGRRTQIILIDERQLDIVVQPRLSVDELLNIVASHCHLKEPDKQYFGLAFVDDKQQYHWLQSERRVLDHEFPRKFSLSGATLVLYHLIKLYAESITSLAHTSSVELYFLQASAQVYRGLIEVDSDSFFQLGAYLVQSYYGDYSNDNTAKNNLKRLPLFSAKILKDFSSVAICEDRVIDVYKTLVGVSRGAAIVNYMQIIEKLHTYGVHFYEIKDKSNNSYRLGISSRGIYQYDVNDRSKPLRGFQWKQLENLYYRDRKFSVEVHDAKRVVHTLSSFNLYEDAMREPLDVSDDLTAAVCDPTTQVSVSRRAFVPSNIHVHVYFCDTPQLCKTIWSLTISQHQFYLDRRTTNKKNGANYKHSVAELAEKLSASITMIGISAHQALAVNAARNNNDNCSTSDLGSSISSQSLHSTPSVTVAAERTEEDQRRDLEYFKQLKSKKLNLEQLLGEKLKELKDVCVKEGTITGEMPAEIKRAMLPGESEPKLQRRVGTAFSISLDVMTKQQSKADQIAKLEADVEIQRKIVTAALKIANDVTANKLIRRKRRRDYQCANLRLRELEQHLHQLRLSSSKPDLPNIDKFVSNGIIGNGIEGPLRTSKSAPNTPRGSVSDLTDASDARSLKSVISHKPPMCQRPPNLPVGHRFNIPSHLREQALQHSSSFPSDPRLFSSSLPTSPQSSSPQTNHQTLPPPCDTSLVYRTEPSGGYRSQAAYQSSYRTQHYPTLTNSSGHLATSSGELNSENSSLQSLTSVDYDTIAPFQRFNRCPAALAVDHQIGAYNIPNQRTSWDYECLNQMQSAAILGSSESLDAVNVPSSPYSVPRFAVGPVLRAPRPQGVTSHCYTGSLDRRVLKQRQKEKWKKMGISNGVDENKQIIRSKSPPLIEAVQLDRSPTRYGVNGRSSSTSYVPTCQRQFSSNSTFGSFNPHLRKMSANDVMEYHQLPLRRKVSDDSAHSSMSTIASGGGSSVELTKPFETSDVLKYSERSRQSPVQLAGNNSAIPLRTPSPYTTINDNQKSPLHAVRRGESSTTGSQGTVPSNNVSMRPGSRLQRQNMAAVDLIAWYDDQDATKSKPATIV